MSILLFILLILVDLYIFIKQAKTKKQKIGLIIFNILVFVCILNYNYYYDFVKNRIILPFFNRIYIDNFLKYLSVKKNLQLLCIGSSLLVFVLMLLLNKVSKHYIANCVIAFIIPFMIVQLGITKTKKGLDKLIESPMSVVEQKSDKITLKSNSYSDFYPKIEIDKNSIEVEGNAINDYEDFDISMNDVISIMTEEEEKNIIISYIGDDKLGNYTISNLKSEKDKRIVFNFISKQLHNRK